MSDNELLLAVSVLLDQKLTPVQERTRNTLFLLENNILPRLQNIEACYTGTARRYADEINHLSCLESDVDILKKNSYRTQCPIAESGTGSCIKRKAVKSFTALRFFVLRSEIP